MTTVINLFGGAGIGKSTLAAELFVRLKQRGVSCELVSEYVKGWAWEGKSVGPFDQVYLLAKQMKAETRLYGKVDYVVTDSPLLLCGVYEKYYGQPVEAAEPAARAIVEAAQANGVKYVNFVLSRDFDYQTEGRYETEVQARDIDKYIQVFLDFHRLEYTTLTGGESSDKAAAILEELAL
jgi:hypothetical protein